MSGTVLGGENEMDENSDSKRAWDFAHDIIGSVTISTIRLPAGGDKPVLYETMILGGKHDLWVKRCLTEEDATQQHAEAVELARGDP
jgi:hypothetical protein